jgi:hypothetical protein
MGKSCGGDLALMPLFQEPGVFDTSVSIQPVTRRPRAIFAPDRLKANLLLIHSSIDTTQHNVVKELMNAGVTTGRLGGEPALNAAWVFRNGVPEEEALKMRTLYPAEMFDLGDRIGSLDAGEDADFMVLEGHPFDYRALPQMVVIDGEVVTDRRPGTG